MSEGATRSKNTCFVNARGRDYPIQEKSVSVRDALSDPDFFFISVNGVLIVASD